MYENCSESQQLSNSFARLGRQSQERSIGWEATLPHAGRVLQGASTLLHGCVKPF